ncbi:hypothetical protein C485_00970 [Natrinema altunense JCM 12890]|uniref:Uncharacterized protein n=1 Tax=Natrinema altunense (strain JCM 12890 / CGMCC 1.3731 / AJ2) TaxID=1227494 RepID=L9ZZR6_NATA2|nr:hypothetical protein C485_00970 [Natrinema altunense JCM 12890]
MGSLAKKRSDERSRSRPIRGDSNRLFVQSRVRTHRGLFGGLSTGMVERTRERTRIRFRPYSSTP